MLDEIQVEEKFPKPTKFKIFTGFLVLAGLAGIFFYFLYQALTNQIKF